MQRTDRLFEIITLLRAATKPVTAQIIAERLEVTPRTVYRHMATLQSMRVPIEGEAGVGYIIRPGYDLPPLNFDTEEREAILVGLSMLSRTGDKKLQAAAQRVSEKINTEARLPEALKVSDWGIEDSDAHLFENARKAVRNSLKLKITYNSLDGANSTRTILPLFLTYHVEVAVIAAWCELRKDFRHFRIDLISDYVLLTESFAASANALRKELEELRPAR
ncbi:MAG: YafY family protein [Pseudomonadota bacterium]